MVLWLNISERFFFTFNPPEWILTYTQTPLTNHPWVLSVGSSPAADCQVLGNNRTTLITTHHYPHRLFSPGRRGQEKRRPKNHLALETICTIYPLSIARISDGRYESVSQQMDSDPMKASTCNLSEPNIVPRIIVFHQTHGWIVVCWITVEQRISSSSLLRREIVQCSRKALGEPCKLKGLGSDCEKEETSQRVTVWVVISNDPRRSLWN